MKIRTGFVSNSSGSSFILVYLPDDFDFYSYKEYMLDKHKSDKYKYMKDILNKIRAGDLYNLINNGYFYENDDSEKFEFLSRFLNEFIILNVEVQEEAGSIKIADKNFLDKPTLIENRYKEKIPYYKELAKEKIKKAEEFKNKIKNIDPFGEEDWGDEIVESSKIRKFKDI